MQDNALEEQNSTAIIKSMQKLESDITTENARIRKLLQFQDSAIDEHRRCLREASEAARALDKVDKQRAAVQSELCAMRTKLILSASESSALSAQIRATVDTAADPIAETRAGVAVGAAAAEIHNTVFGVTEECLQSNDLCVSPDAMNDLVLKISDIVQKCVDGDRTLETAEDKILRQEIVISSLCQKDKN